jgi:short-subunit dehydrogenase
MEKKTIIVVGAGKGLGNHVAEKFGTEGYRVILMARNPESLDAYKKELTEKGIEAYTHTADAAVPETLTEAFDWAKQKFGTPDVLFYNVGITAPVEDGKTDARELTRHFIVDVASAYHCFKLVCDEDFINRNGSVIFTGGGLAEYPTMGFLPLSIDKAALKAMAVAIHDEMAPKGVFVGTVTIYGSIGIDRFFAPAQIANRIWELNQYRDVCEVKYAYPELDGRGLDATHYWSEAFSLADKYR